MSKRLILAIFDPGKLCTLYCDASQEGIEAVLKQTDGDGIEHPVAYYSRKLLNHERNYSITDLECLAIVDAVDKWHCYLHGHQFTVITDHAALKWLKTIKKPCGRLFRRSLKLSMYAYTIKRLKGTDNVEADALSRSPIVGFTDIEDNRQAQPDLPPDHQNCCKENGIFVMRRKGPRKVFVPHSLRQQAIKKAHEDYGHVGVKKMLGLLSPQYYWPDIKKDVSASVKHCDICQKCKNSKQKRFGLLKSLPPAEVPFDLLAMDTVGGLTGYNSAKRFIHVAVDHTTRYVRAFAHKSETSDAYVSCLQQILTTGSPKKFLSDRGSGFIGNTFKRFMKNHGIHQVMTSTQRPQCNGMNEGTNQTIVTRLKFKINELPKTPWPKLL
ncbi:hypothetical protein ISCGN_022452 [Ixodes scapularis]